MKQAFTVGLLLIAMAGCATEPAEQDYPDPAELSCEEIFETSHQILEDSNWADLKPLDPLPIKISKNRLLQYADELEGCKEVLLDEEKEGAYGSVEEVEFQDLIYQLKYNLTRHL